MTQEKETRASPEEMKRVKRCWSLPPLQLGPGALAHLYVKEHDGELHCAGTELLLPGA